MSAPNIGEEVDPTSRTWRIIDAYMASRLNHLRKQLEGNLSEQDTAITRGRIREINEFMTNTRPAGVPPAGSPNDRGPLSY